MNNPDKNKKRNFFGRLMERLDKKMEEKAKTKSCCDKKEKNKGKSCCS